MAAAPKSDATPPAAEAAPAAAAAAPAGGMKAWLPTIMALVLAPAACWAVVQFVLLPQLKASLTIEVAANAPAPGVPGVAPVAGAVVPAAGKTDAGGKAAGKAAVAEGGAVGSYRFENVVVNLAGTMGTRYLKTTFLVTSSQADIATRFEAARPQLIDITIGVLSSLTLQDLEEPGAKNVIREKLVNSYNQALGSRIADQVYFSDFVIQ